MCGIVALVTPDGVDEARAMMESLRHRGPDAEGIQSYGRCTLAMTRLAILDPTSRANQPMGRGTKRLVYNGEVYNFRELRSELESQGVRFETSGDTEVVLFALERWGLGALARFRGMFALACWDVETGELWLARDRFGIKPLYWRAHGKGIAVASECRALRGEGPLEVNSSAVAEFLQFGSPLTAAIAAGVIELEPGTSMIWKDGRIKSERFAGLPAADATPQEGGAGVAFADAVAMHLVSDRPVAVFLSGGFDSTTLMSACRAGSQMPLALTISHEGNSEDVERARRTAAHYGAIHEIVPVSVSDVVARMPRLVAAMDQPSIDGVNTYLVSAAARERGIPVALSGLGGDEVLGGYSYHSVTSPQALASRIWRRSPMPVRSVAGRVIGRRSGQSGERVSSVLAARTPQERFCAYRELFTEEEVRQLVGSAVDRSRPRWNLDPALTERSQYAALDFDLYLRPTLLRDSDVMSMANGVEVRVPYLDGEFVATTLGASRVPSKVEFAEALDDAYLAVVAGEPKRTFAMPWRAWLPTVVSTYSDLLLSQADPWGGAIDDRRARDVLRRPLPPGRMGPLRTWALVVLALWMQEKKGEL